MVRRGRIVAVEGGSASGKTTLVIASAHAFGWRPLPEAVDRLDPAPSLEFTSPKELLRLETTLLTEESLRYREARELVAKGATVLADTGFFGPLTYTLGLVELGRAPPDVMRTLARIARPLVRSGRLGIPDLTVYLRTTATERARRARAGARRHPASLFARHEAVGRVERRLFDREFPSVLPDRFRTLRAAASPAELTGRLRTVVESAAPTRSSRAEALRLLDHLGGPNR